MLTISEALKLLKQEENQPIEEDITLNLELNPALFADNKLKPEVREVLLNNANNFIKDIKEDGVKIEVKDILLLGSNAGYNYNQNSDIDLHIITNTSGLDCADKHLPLLYSLYRDVYNKKYDEVKIKGFEVEIFVENDETAVKHSNGIYSVLHDKWIKEPVHEPLPEIDAPTIDAEIKKWEQRYLDIVNINK